MAFSFANGAETETEIWQVLNHGGYLVREAEEEYLD